WHGQSQVTTRAMLAHAKDTYAATQAVRESAASQTWHSPLESLRAENGNAQPPAHAAKEIERLKGGRSFISSNSLREQLPIFGINHALVGDQELQHRP